MQWEEVASLARKGDGSAFNELLQAARPIAWSVMRGRKLSHHEMMDIEQDFTIALAKIANGGLGRKPWPPYLKAVANNLVRRTIRMKKKEEHKELEESMIIYEDQTREKEEVYAELRDTMRDTLSEEDQDILTRIYWGKSTLKIVAKELNLSVASVNRRKKVALSVLRTALKERGIHTSAPWLRRQE